MRLRRLIWGSALAVSLAAPAVADGEGYGRHDADPRFVPGEALVRYSPGTDAGERRELRSAASVDFSAGLRASTSGTIQLRVRRR